MSSTSILYSGARLEQDEALVTAIVSKVALARTTNLEELVAKIMSNIATPHWQSRFPQRYFVFSAYQGMLRDVIEVRSGLSFQAIDALYPYICKPGTETEKNFARKFRRCFKVVYGYDMPTKTSEAIRLLRNRIIHTGTIVGNGFWKADDAELRRLFETVFSREEDLGEERLCMSLASSTNYLIGDMIVRVLGLKWSDLITNLNPPSRLPMFCKPGDRRKPLLDMQEL